MTTTNIGGMISCQISGLTTTISDYRQRLKKKPKMLNITHVISDIDQYTSKSLIKFIAELKTYLRKIPKSQRHTAHIKFSRSYYGDESDLSYTITYRRPETQNEISARIRIAKKAQKEQRRVEIEKKEAERALYFELKKKFERSK